jgi:hypothetical protein
VLSFERGPKNIARPESGLAGNGEASNALGPALENGVVSLGDGGCITIGFPVPIADGPGPDFAVFENGFSDGFLELALVEVSSNGIDFFPFTAISETGISRQIGPFDTLDARCLNQLAGKYRAGFGTPFDLSNLSPNRDLDLFSICCVRIRDVVGSLNPEFGTRDARGNLINDPWPTEFESGGFDLDAVAALHLSGSDAPLIWPSVLKSGSPFFSDATSALSLLSFSGQPIAQFPASTGKEAKLPAGLPAGVYYFREENKSHSRKVLIE